MNQPKVGVGAVIFNSKNEVLLVLRKKQPDANCWSLPGGKVEWFETIEDATRREIKEEVNVDITLDHLVCVTNHILPLEAVHFVCPTFSATISGGQVHNNEPDKLAKVAWFPLNELPKNLTYTTTNALKNLEEE